MLKEFSDYPKYKQAYISAFERMIENRKAKGKIVNGDGYHNWTDGEAVFEWWLEEYKRNIKGQMTMEDMLNE